MNDDHRRAKENENDGILEWTRRNFLKYVGGAAAAGVVPEILASCAQPVEEGVMASETPLAVGPIGGSVAKSYILSRASDGLDMQMDLYNLQVNAANMLVQTAAATPSYVILRTHPQHISESVANIELNSSSASAGLVITDLNYDDIKSISSGPSQMVFYLAPGLTPTPFNLRSILNVLSAAPLNVAANALSDAAFPGNTAYELAAVGVSNAAPLPTVTSIEIPFRLLLSPNELGRFVHSNPPATLPSSGRVEVFNSRLTAAAPGGSAVRALYTRDSLQATTQATLAKPITPLTPLGLSQPAITLNNAPIPITEQGGASLEALPSFIRERIVAQSGTFIQYGTNPTSIPVDNLVLTPYGGTLQANGTWENATSGLQSWKHRTSMGRDAYVQATLLGYVLPFGLRAMVVMTVQRQMSTMATWTSNPTGEFAILEAQWQLHLIDTQNSFSNFPGLPLLGHRAMPFATVTAQQTTFVIDAPNTISYSANPNDTTGQTINSVATLSFAVTSGGQPLCIPMTAIDRRGRVVTFNAPAYWCCDDASNSVKTGSTLYTSGSGGTVPTSAGAILPNMTPSTNVISFNRQRVGLAPSTKDHTTVEVDWMAFGVVPVPSGAVTAFYPYVSAMSAFPTAARALGGADVSALMTYDKSYVVLPPTPGTVSGTTLPGSPETTPPGGVLQGGASQTLVNIAGLGVSAAFPSAKGTGGLALPNATFGAIGLVSGLANSAGDIAASATAAATTALSTLPPPFDWSKLLAGAKLFGEISLIDFATAAGLSKLPTFIAEAYSVVERYAAELELLVEILPQLPAFAAGTAAAANATALATLNTALNGIAGVTPPAGVVAFLQNPIATNAAALISSIANDVVTLGTQNNPTLATIQSALASVGPPNSGLARAAQNQLAKLQSALIAGGDAMTAAMTAIQQGLDVARDQKAKIEWHALVPWNKQIPSGIGLITSGSTGTTNLGSNFSLSVEVNGKASDVSQALTMFCSFDNFTLNFPPSGMCSPWLKLHFDRIFVSQLPGKKMEVDVNFAGIDFLQCLQFIQVIESLIPLGGFSDPPNVDVTDNGITAGFSAGLPNVAACALSFENMKLSAELNVPFFGDAITFSFDFCDSDHPFLVTVAFLGGGGYLNLTMASKGDGGAIQSLEASICVAAQAAIDIVVASGSLSATAGITISYDVATTTVSITAFVDLRGAMDILGLISMSIEAYIGLTYTSPNSLSGTCIVTVDVEVCYVSKSVSLTFHQQFCGGASPTPSFKEDVVTIPGPAAQPITTCPQLSPSFSDVFSEATYQTYLGAFA